jgi:hypothetical protein
LSDGKLTDLCTAAIGAKDHGRAGEAQKAAVVARIAV